MTSGGSAAEPGVALHLGRDMAVRLRLPGPPRRRRRPTPIGSLASASQRFAAALSQPVHIRGTLRGPRVVVVAPIRAAATRPPRWWRPVAAASAPVRWWRAREVIPRRGLPRAVQQVPTEAGRAPGGIVAGLVTTAAPVRRHSETVAAGPMTTSHDVARLTATRPRADARAVSQPRPAPAPPAPPVRSAPKPLPKRPPARAPSEARTPPPPPPPPTAPVPEPAEMATPAPAPTGPEPAEPAPTEPAATEPAATEPAATEPAQTPPAPPAASNPPAPPSWLPARTSRLAAARDREPVAAHRDRRPASTTRTARTSGLTLRLAGVAAISLTARRPALLRRESPLRRPPGRVVMPRLQVSTASPRLPLLPSLSRIVNADITRARPFRALRAAPRPARTPQPTTWTEAAATGKPRGPITLAATRGIAGAVAPAATAAVAHPQPAEPAASTPQPAPEQRPVPVARPEGLPLAARHRLAAAVGTSSAVAVATRPATTRAPLGAVSHVPAATPQRRHPLIRIGAVGRTRRELTVAAERTQRVAMTGLLATRAPAHRPVAAGRPPLASAFGPADEARVVTTATAAVTAEAAAVVRPTIGAHRAEPQVTAPAAPPLPRSRLDAALGKAAALAGKARESTERAGTSLRAKARAARDTARELRHLLPAPPRVSVTVKAPASKPPPAAQRPARMVPGPDGALRPSLIDTTAALFAAKFGTGPATSIPAGLTGEPMGAHQMSVSPIRPQPADRATPEQSLLDDPRALDELTDKVVDRIEARVIDELERRGRRHNTGVF